MLFFHQVHHTIRKVHKVDIFIKKQMFQVHNLRIEFPMKRIQTNLNIENKGREGKKMSIVSILPKILPHKYALANNFPNSCEEKRRSDDWKIR